MVRVKPAGIRLRVYMALTPAQQQHFLLHRDVSRFAPHRVTAAAAATGTPPSKRAAPIGVRHGSSKGKGKKSVALTGALAGFRKETRWCSGGTRKYFMYISPFGVTFFSEAAALRAVGWSPQLAGGACGPQSLRHVRPLHALREALGF